MTIINVVHVCMDRKSNKGDCKYHFMPSCHPANIGPEPVYGCQHQAWPANKANDFMPIVECGGYKNKCEMRGQQFIARHIKSLERKASKQEASLKEIKTEIREIKKLTGVKNGQKNRSKKSA